MRLLIDVVHPAHVHFYRNVIEMLVARGHSVAVASRRRDVTVDLLDSLGIEHRIVSTRRRTRLGQAIELVARDVRLARIARRNAVDMVLSRNPSGMHAARLAGAIGVFDTDDGPAAGTHYRLAARFAHVITSPSCLDYDLGPKHRKYSGFKSLAYLHPKQFTPDAAVLTEMGLSTGDEFFVVRVVAMAAAHDRRESGMPLGLQRALVEKLARRGTVLVTAESKLPPDMDAYRVNIESHRLHDLLAFARLYVGDSQTMAAEAAILGTPAIRVTSWAGRLSCVDRLEDDYGLVRSFGVQDNEAVLRAVTDVLDRDRSEWAARRERVLEDSIDVSAWYVNLIETIADG